MQRYFFRHKVPLGSHVAMSRQCSIQIPSLKDTTQMHGMPAGGEEDQLQRLRHMSQTLEKIQLQDASLPIMNTDHATLPAHWNRLFAAINRGEKDTALRFLSLIPEQDTILQSLLAVHRLEYLQVIIDYSVQAKQKGMKQLNPDILITPGTFEVLIKDLALTLFHSATVHLSFGLPTHHAYGDEGKGFCVLNKTAVLIKNTERMHDERLKYVIVGTDVNRDNGLCDILMKSATHMDICHVDVFDSRVYPGQDHFFIAKELRRPGKEVGQKIQSWQRGNVHYFAVDLSQTTRQPGATHPALVFALQKTQEQIEDAKAKGQRIALFLPTGWDSHEDETAYCGKFVDDEIMSSSEAKKTRFNDSDLTFFYGRLFALYKENQEHIAKVYWGLEGGYERTMYERQIKLMMSLVLEELVHRDLDQMVPDNSR